MLEIFEFDILFMKQRIQEAYLKSHSLNLRHYIKLLNSYIDGKGNDDRITVINRILRENIYISSSTIEVLSYPLKEGDTSIIQTRLKEQLLNFKKKHHLLFPLLYPIKVVIIATEPINIARKVDIDNIARTHVLPLLINNFEPPSDRIIPDYIKKQSKFYLNHHDIKGIPKNGILAYEVIKIQHDKQHVRSWLAEKRSAAILNISN